MVQSRARAADMDDRSINQTLMSNAPDVVGATLILQDTRPGNEASVANEDCDDEFYLAIVLLLIVLFLQEPRHFLAMELWNLYQAYSTVSR